MNNFLEPLYLGKSSPEKGKGSAVSYFFFASKNGLGRFLKYSNYPYWAAASNLPDFLVLEELPEVVMNEVKAFIEGRLKFEVIPKTQGRAEKVLRKEVFYNKENGVNNVTVQAGILSETALTDTGRGTVERGESKSETPGLEKGSQDLDSQRHRVSTPSKGSGTARSEGTGDIPPAGRRTGTDEVRGLSGDEPGRSSGPGRYDRSVGVGKLQSPAPSESGARRKSDHGILGNGRRDPEPVSNPVTMDKPGFGSVDGNDSSGVKSRRVRRTKEELASGRSLVDIRASRER